MTVQRSPARRLRDAIEPIAALSFWSTPSTDAYAAVGLPDFFPAYFWSRSSPLGTADASVVAAVFGVFEPGLVEQNLRIGQRTCSLDAIRAATVDGAGDAVRAVLADVPVDDIRSVVALLRRGVDAADGTGRPLFSGNRSWQWPDDPYSSLWRVATAWRELRGDSHVAALVANGVSGLQANILTELEVGYRLGEYTATRNWSDDEIHTAADELRDRGLVSGDALTDAGTRFRDGVEQATDTAVAPAVAALGSEIEGVAERAEQWAQKIIDHGWFPDDSKKRAAG